MNRVLVWKGLCVLEEGATLPLTIGNMHNKAIYQYIFSSLVRKGNLNKRFELQSSLITHIL